MSFEGIQEQSNNEAEDVLYAQDFERKIETPDYINLCRKQMQVDLAGRYYGFRDDSVFMDWIMKDSKKFAEIIKEHPEFLDEYMHGDSDDALNKVSDLLYEKKTTVDK
ncbi:MAG: hypothetical protein V4524_03300 [Patescibacteria group bacterium]